MTRCFARSMRFCRVAGSSCGRAILPHRRIASRARMRSHTPAYAPADKPVLRAAGLFSFPLAFLFLLFSYRGCRGDFLFSFRFSLKPKRGLLITFPLLITLPRCSFRTSLSGVVSEGVAEVETYPKADRNRNRGGQQNLCWCHLLFLLFEQGFIALFTLDSTLGGECCKSFFATNRFEGGIKGERTPKRGR